MPHNPKTTQKPTAVGPHISVNNGRMGMLKVPILRVLTASRRLRNMNE